VKPELLRFGPGNSEVSSRAGVLIQRLPLRGRPVRLSLKPDLKCRRGKLTSGGSRGVEVHAGTFLPQRRIVLDQGLLRGSDFERILTHELFHFAWVRLGNPRRFSWEQVLVGELASSVPGELGWSAEYRKEALSATDRTSRTRRWRAYACESFCDTAAWLYAGLGRHAEFTLRASARAERRRWFRRCDGFLI
jgi:hypothetical protein